MATQEVLLSTCDRCTTEVTTPIEKKKGKSGDYVLPKGWLHVQGNTAGTLVFEMDLCEECAGIVMEAAGKARHLHSVSQLPTPTQLPEAK
jgi:hypothetical protein